MRFAQMIITKFDKIVWEVKESLDETSRGVDGFGSTGLR
jgi:dUTP pyrophosphatase